MEPIGVGIIGWGLGGRGFHGAFVAAVEGFELRAVVTSRLIDGERYPNARAVPDVDALLGRDDIDLVVVASPNRLHAPNAVAALRANKHVIIEKPVTRTVADFDFLAETAAKAERHLIPYMNRRFDGDFVTVKKLLDDGRLGDVHTFVSRWPTYKPSTEARSAWKAEPDAMNGVLYDIGPHLIDQAIVLFGRPSHVWAQLETNRPGGAVPDLARLHLLYPSGPTVRIEVDQLDGLEPARFVVVGTGGAFEKRGIDAQEDGIRADVVPSEPNWGEELAERWGRLVTPEGDTAIETERGDYKRFYEAVGALLRGEAETPAPLADVRLQLEIIETALRSAESGHIEPVGS